MLINLNIWIALFLQLMTYNLMSFNVLTAQTPPSLFYSNSGNAVVSTPTSRWDYSMPMFSVCCYFESTHPSSMLACGFLRHSGLTQFRTKIFVGVWARYSRTRWWEAEGVEQEESETHFSYPIRMAWWKHYLQFRSKWQLCPYTIIV